MDFREIIFIIGIRRSKFEEEGWKGILNIWMRDKEGFFDLHRGIYFPPGWKNGGNSVPLALLGIAAIRGADWNYQCGWSPLYKWGDNGLPCTLFHGRLSRDILLLAPNHNKRFQKRSIPNECVFIIFTLPYIPLTGIHEY